MSCNAYQTQPDQPRDLDYEIAALTFQLDEIQSNFAIQKGKHKEDQPPDGILALFTFRRELEAWLTILKDSKLAQSISQAANSDAPAIAEAIGEERQNVRDRRLALQLSGQKADCEITLPYAEQDYDGNIQMASAEQRVEVMKQTSLFDSRDQVCRVFHPTVKHH
jgi:hypothetical protein